MEVRERAKPEEEQEEVVWTRETVPRVLEIVSTRLPQRDLISLLLVSPWIHRSLTSHPSLWLVLDFHEMNNAGNRLVSALSQSRYMRVKQISLEFAQDIEDKHADIIKTKCSDSLQNLECLNLNGCQKISDNGVEVITSICPNLRVFSIYWNVRVTDFGIEHLVNNCKHIVDLNLSGCKKISDKSLQLIADNYQQLECLNLTRCIKLTDDGLRKILVKCSSLRSLNLYAVSCFTDEAYKKISLLTKLRFLDLCGAQNLTDQGLSCIAKCHNLVSLNLTWCVRITDEGVIALAEGCTSLEFLSLFGIVGVTDKCLEALSKSCSSSITTFDVNGCIGIKGVSFDSAAIFLMFRLTNQIQLLVHYPNSYYLQKISLGSAIQMSPLFPIVAVHQMSSSSTLIAKCDTYLNVSFADVCISPSKRRSREELLQLFPHLRCFKVHS